jgi:hypothetical protein
MARGSISRKSDRGLSRDPHGYCIFWNSGRTKFLWVPQPSTVLLTSLDPPLISQIVAATEKAPLCYTNKFSILTGSSRTRTPVA